MLRRNVPYHDDASSAFRDFTREESDAPPTLCAFATDETGKLVPEWNYLSNFFKRYNKVILDKAALDKEKRRLLDDNAKLKYVLKQYLDGITVNGEALKDPKNPLLVSAGENATEGGLKVFRDGGYRGGA